ncbi:hypothetical protein GWI33_014312 [Rhynchophorus ferrugineus]|uniref:Uncharacterized protein n=1 Tax=Rhynchophorus ferrugineus TaxID=354439 RepID=A0A834MCG4_RHYFE|nr:hypothetical protein GWI33_014312 [Rhynchophorus ferrugineus]
METAFSFMDFDLHEVAANGCFSILLVALDNLHLYKFDVDRPDDQGNVLLHYAVENDSTETVEKLLHLKANCDIPNAKGDTPLHLACFHGHLNMVKLLVHHGSTINAADHNGETPIFKAIRGKHLPITKYLISLGADVTCRNISNENILHIAACTNDDQTLQLLLLEGFDVNKTNDCGPTPLELAITNGAFNAVKLLWNVSAGYMIRDIRNCSLLHLAVIYNQPETCMWLISQNIDVNAGDVNGSTALHYAADTNRADILKYLLQNGANIDQKDEDDYTALHVAAAHSSSIPTLEILLRYRARIDCETVNGDLPLHRAAACGNEKAIQLLFNNELILRRNKSGLTPALIAKECGQSSAVYILEKLLLKERKYRSVSIRKKVSFAKSNPLMTSRELFKI